MSKKTKGLGQRPAGQGVGGKTLVKEADRGLHAQIGQIRVKARQINGPAEPLVDDDHIGEGGYIKIGIVNNAFF